MLKSRSKARSHGFSLIEVLISMLILAFGVLSMGGLQLAALKSSQMAGNMSLAATLAKDYSEMMRSNWSVSNVTSTVAGVNPYLFDTNAASTFTATAPDCIGAACTPANIATLHVADWAQRVTSKNSAGVLQSPVQLAGARAVVCRDSPSNYQWTCSNSNTASFVIKVGWIDKREKEERGTTTLSATPLAPQFVMSTMAGYAE